MKEAVASVFVALVLAVGGAVAILGAYNPSTTTTPLGPADLSQTNSSTGLKFRMALNSSALQQGQTLAVSFELYNPSNTVNNVTGASDWRLTNDSENSGSSVSWNCAQNDVFRIEALSGYYGLNNFSNGAPLDVFIWQPPFAFNECPLYARPANRTAPVLSVP